MTFQIKIILSNEGNDPKSKGGDSACLPPYPPLSLVIVFYYLFRGDHNWGHHSGVGKLKAKPP